MYRIYATNWYILAFSWGQQRILKTKALNVMGNLRIFLMKNIHKIYTVAKDFLSSLIFHSCLQILDYELPMGMSIFIPMRMMCCLHWMPLRCSQMPCLPGSLDIILSLLWPTTNHCLMVDYLVLLLVYVSHHSYYFVNLFKARPTSNRFWIPHNT